MEAFTKMEETDQKSSMGTLLCIHGMTLAKMDESMNNIGSDPSWYCDSLQRGRRQGGKKEREKS